MPVVSGTPPGGCQFSRPTMPPAPFILASTPALFITSTTCSGPGAGAGVQTATTKIFGIQEAIAVIGHQAV